MGAIIDQVYRFETSKEYVEMKREFFVPQARMDSKGVRVIVK